MLPLILLFFTLVCRGRVAGKEFKIIDGVMCLANPVIKSDQRCHITADVADWLLGGTFEYIKELFQVYGEKDLSKDETTKLQGGLGACIVKDEDFVPIQRRITYEYFLCTFRTRVVINSRPFMVFFPDDDQDNIAECDVLPWLMRLATSGKGVAIDIGAGHTGDCSWPLLSEGHSVHMFERGYEQDPAIGEFVQLTRDVNGWQDVATLHGEVNGRKRKFIKRLFKHISRIELLKIDVDDLDSYMDVFSGIKAILNKTEVIQIEMLEEEIGIGGKFEIFDHFDSRGFELFGLEDVDTFPGFQHTSLGGPCKNGDMPGIDDRILHGIKDYKYGQNGPEKLRMFPLCKCGPASVNLKGRGQGSADPLRCNSQFAFVRRDSLAMETIANLYGSCTTVCIDHHRHEM